MNLATRARLIFWDGGNSRCRGVANLSRVAECTRLSPEGEYSGLARTSSISLVEHDEHSRFRVVRAAGA